LIFLLGGGGMGHPRVYINLDKNKPIPCGYCGLKYVQVHEYTKPGETPYYAQYKPDFNRVRIFLW
jgi:hypothetical protein